MRKSIEDKSLSEAVAAFRVFMKKTAKAAQKKIIHKNKAARKIRQLAHKLHQLNAHNK